MGVVRRFVFRLMNLPSYLGGLDGHDGHSGESDVLSFRESRSCLKPVVVIVGPTAVGKSRVAVEVAKAFETEVLTAGAPGQGHLAGFRTDKPASAERQGIPHRLIDLVNPDESFNTGLYRRQALG